MSPERMPNRVGNNEWVRKGWAVTDSFCSCPCLRQGFGGQASPTSPSGSLSVDREGEYNVERPIF